MVMTEKYEKNIKFCLPNMVHKHSIVNNLRCLQSHDHDGMDLVAYILVHLLQHEIHPPIFRLAVVPNLKEKQKQISIF